MMHSITVFVDLALCYEITNLSDFIFELILVLASRRGDALEIAYYLWQI